MRIVLCIFLAVVLVVTAKLGYEQLFHASQLERGALEARLREMDIKPERGTIYDRKGSALAISVATESVYINPTVIRKEDQKEKIQPSQTPAGQSEKEENSDGYSRKTGASSGKTAPVKTGDDTHLFMYVLLELLAFSGIVSLRKKA